MTGVLIADDHPLFRSALATAVRRVDPQAAIAEAETLTGAVEHLRANASPALVLLDLRMPDCEGFTGLLALRAEFPAVPVVVVSASEESETVRRALSFGAAGFIPKSSSLEVLISALRAVLEGEVWSPPIYDDDCDELTQRIASLTPAQLRMLVELRKGQLNKQIAFDMGISEATVKAHMSAIFRKLGVANRTQALLAAKTMLLEADTV